MADGGVDLSALSPQHLKQVGEQLESDLQKLAESMQNLQAAVTRYHSSGVALETLRTETEGKPMLVPMTESLYVPGRMGSVATVTVDIGTGYYVEKTPAEGVDYCKRKVMLLKENIEKLMQIIGQKNQQMREVERYMKSHMAKMQQAMAQQQQAQANAVA
mmetsp:Transcript_7819/g.25967  ORF Transcript_7819/g.25967 Transcript_7819/m.25967 type:complete len:160 (+) Transcript_7819:35-514(+)